MTGADSDGTGGPARLDAAGLPPALDHAPDVIFVTDAEDRFLYINRAVLAVTGLSPEALIGKPFILVVNPSDHGLALDALEGVRLDRHCRPQVVEMAWRSSGPGGACPMEVALRAVRAGAHLAYVVGVGRDLSRRGEYLDERLTSERVAAIVELAFVTADKVANPLAILSMQLGVLEHAIEHGEAIPPDTINAMRQAVARISEVIGDLRAIADSSVQGELRGRPTLDLGGRADRATEPNEDV